MSEVKQYDKWRLGLHLMPPTGWLNDPNGLCQFNGVYHAFFQYTPDNPEGGRKYWGHYISSDLLSWEYAGIALLPDEPFDRHGVYSGSALVLDGVMHLFYTGNVKLRGNYNYITDGREGNTVLVSSEDGIRFGEKKCLMTNLDYPDDLTCHVRDPKVVTGESIGIQEPEYYMFLGARTNKDEGEILVYKGETLESWELCNVLKTEQPFGYMWECPDAFMLGDKKILSVSPQGIAAEGINYQNIYQSGYYELEGSFASEYSLRNFKEWDRGFDFYAPQTFLDEQGRRILIGWIGMPDDPKQSNPTVEDGWQNALTVPRELSLQNGQVVQYPVKELKRLRRAEEKLLCGEQSPEMGMYDLEIAVEENQDLEVIISEGIAITYQRNNKLFMLEFYRDKNIGYGREKRSVHLDSSREVRILADTSCLEIYVNQGEEVFTTRFYTETGKSSFLLTKGAGTATYWELSSMTMKAMLREEK